MQTSKNVGANDKLKVNAKKAYKPSANSAQDNDKSWDVIKKELAKGPKTRAHLEATLKKECNHKPFVGYCIRRGWLVA